MRMHGFSSFFLFLSFIFFYLQRGIHSTSMQKDVEKCNVTMESPMCVSYTLHKAKPGLDIGNWFEAVCSLS